MHADGAGLYLQVSGVGARSWIYRFMLRGRAREMGLGSLRAVSLSEARAAADDCRRLRQRGIDPIEAKKAARERERFDAARAFTFEDAARTYVSTHRAGWRNEKHAAQWSNTLVTYAAPVFGALPVDAIDTGLVLKVLEPIWATKPETASRLRGRIEAILDWAAVRGFRRGDNPARWRGHLDKLLPAQSRLHVVRHHAALPFTELPTFFQQLRRQQGIAARALAFTILTAARTGETIGAAWDEIDRRHQIWTVPSNRLKVTKNGRPHRVPLSALALDVAGTRPAGAIEDPFVFSGSRTDRPLSNMALLAVLRRMGRCDLTVHGFRSTFRDWAAERTETANEVVEMALGHAIADKVEAAYRRGDLLDKRRRLMDLWAAYCGSSPSSR
jgi:integrase